MIILFLLVNLFYFYTAMPVMAWGFTDWSTPLILWGLFLFFFAARSLVQKGRALLIRSSWGRLLEKWLAGQEDAGEVDITNYKRYARDKNLAFLGMALIIAGLLNSFFLPVITSHPLLFSQAYRELLGPVQESSFTADIEPINLSQIRIVDEETATKLADKKIGEVPALGSETRLGEMTLQKVQNGLYYVAPLEHRGLFQWLVNHSQGSKGYVMVSATNPQDVRLVQSINGQDVRIKYQMGGFLLDYLPRYLYAHGFVNAGLTDFSFQLDNDLNPYWVVTLYKNKVGYSGADATGVVVVNAQNGDIARYSLTDMPEWINRVQPPEIIYQQIEWWGEYINGFWNAAFAKTGTLRPTGDQLHLIYGNDNNAYWYTGITSSGKDESTVGFVLVNSRTKEAKWYKVAGATEAAARKSAEGQVQEKGYRAGYPVLYNINGIPTYIAPLKDKEGLLKQVAYISVENYNLVGVGPDIESALRAYQLNLANTGNTFIPGNEIKQIKLQGKVTRFSQVVKGGDSYFYFLIENDPRIFVGTINTSPKLPLVKLGDAVAIVFNDTKESPVNILQFDVAGY